MSRRVQQPRGQAIVEAALGIMVFITVLVFGIHFAEVTFTSMKVTEAGQAAVWDSTAGNMHTLVLDYNAVDGLVSGAGATTNGRYSDFEGRANAPPTSGPKGLFSRAVPGSMNIQCQTGVGLGQRAGHFLLALEEFAVYRDNDGMRCSADAMLDPFGTMKLQAGLNDFGIFAKGTGGARAGKSGSTAFNAGYKVCEVGRPGGIGGNCRGNFEMLIDDWGLASGSGLGGSENSSCLGLPLGIPCVGGNMPFWTGAYLMYNLKSLIFQTQNNADLDMVKLVGNPPFYAWFGTYFTPGHPTSFYMSYMGSDYAFLQPTMPGDASWPIWFTTPFGIYFPTYTWGYVNANECYLGTKYNCNAGTIQNP